MHIPTAQTLENELKNPFSTVNENRAKSSALAKILDILSQNNPTKQ
jgi:hypothetical protein